MGSHKERVDALIAEAKDLIEEIAQEGREAVAEAERVADSNVARHRELLEERDLLSAQADHLRNEREELPAKAYRAGLDGEYALEDELTGRYREAGSELDRVKARIPEIEEELRELEGPNGGGHDNEVMIRQYSRVNKAAAGPLVELRRLGSEVSVAATREASHFEQVLEDRRGESWAWRQGVNWSEESREKLRRSGNLPGEDRTRTIKADPARLREGVGNPPGLG